MEMGTGFRARRFVGKPVVRSRSIQARQQEEDGDVSGLKGEVSCVRRHPPRRVALACVASSRQAISALGRSSLTLETMAMAGFGQKRSVGSVDKSVR